MTVIKARRMLTQEEIDANVAKHLPHADWCGRCVKGRGRRTPRRWKRRRKDSIEYVDVSSRATVNRTGENALPTK